MRERISISLRFSYQRQYNGAITISLSNNMSIETVVIHNIPVKFIDAIYKRRTLSSLSSSSLCVCQVIISGIVMKKGSLFSLKQKRNIEINMCVEIDEDNKKKKMKMKMPLTKQQIERCFSNFSLLVGIVFGFVS